MTATATATADLEQIAAVLEQAGLNATVAAPMSWPGPGVAVTGETTRPGSYLITPVITTGCLRVRWTPHGGRHMESIGDAPTAQHAAAMVLDHQDDLLP